MTDLAQITAVLEVGYTGENPKDLQKASLYIYRALANGKSISFASIAEHLGTPVEKASRLLNLVPQSAIELDDDGHIIGFVGLSLAPTAHRFETTERSLYTWCVFDALFLPSLIEQAATLHTTCPNSHTDIEIKVTSSTVAAIAPDSPVMSLTKTDTKSCCKDLRGAFCDQVNIFADQAAFDEWRLDRSDAISVSLSQAFSLAQQRNAWRYSDVDY